MVTDNSLETHRGWDEYTRVHESNVANDMIATGLSRSQLMTAYEVAYHQVVETAIYSAYRAACMAHRPGHYTDDTEEAASAVEAEYNRLIVDYARKNKLGKWQ